MTSEVSITLSARTWAGIDAGVDNAVSLAAQHGDEVYEQLGDDVSAQLCRDAIAVIEAALR